MSKTITMAVALAIFGTPIGVAQAQEMKRMEGGGDVQLKVDAVTPIPLPELFGTAAKYDPSAVELWVSGAVLIYTGNWGYELPQGLYWEFDDMRMAPPVRKRIHYDDSISVRFADGSTVEMQFMGVPAQDGLYFHVTPGTEKDRYGMPIRNEILGDERHLSFDGSGVVVSWDNTWMTFYNWGHGVTRARNQR